VAKEFVAEVGACMQVSHVGDPDAPTSTTANASERSSAAPLDRGR